MGTKDTKLPEPKNRWPSHSDDSAAELSLDELISNFQQSAPKHRIKHDENVSNAHTLKESTLKYSKNRNNKSPLKKREFELPQQKVCQKREIDDSSDDEIAISPMPRLERVLRNKPSLLLKSRVFSTASNMKKTLPRRQCKSKGDTSLPSCPSLTPLSLSPMTASPSPVFKFTKIKDVNMPLTSEEDSIDALSRKDIRHFNKMMLAKKTQTRSKKTSPSPSKTNKYQTFSRPQDSVSKDLFSPRQVQKIHRNKLKLSMPELPSPPSSIDCDILSDKEEDSFDAEIRKMRASYQKSLQNEANVSPEKDIQRDSSEICATVAVKIRNATNTINEMLFEALKPFEDRQYEKEEIKVPEKEKAEDLVTRSATTVELQATIQTIVSQLDFTFANMTQRRKTDLKAEADAVAAALEMEQKKKEIADKKKAADEMEREKREMDILQRIPLQGKLLSCSSELESVLEELETKDMSSPCAIETASAIEAKLKALERQMNSRIEEIGAHLSAKPLNEEQSSKNECISWQAANWMKDNIFINEITSPKHNNTQPLEEIQDTNMDAALAKNEEHFEQILQRQVLEKLDLTMLRLRHVLAIDSKEAAEVLEKQQREKAEQERQEAEQLLINESKQRELKDAEHARRRVMGFTSVNEIEEWGKESGCDVQNECFNTQEQALYQFDRLRRTMAIEEATNDLNDVLSKSGSSWQAQNEDLKRQKHFLLERGVSLSRKSEKRYDDYQQYPARRKLRDNGSKTNRYIRKYGASSFLQEVSRTIQVLQAERRQKSTWIQSHFAAHQ